MNRRLCSWIPTSSEVAEVCVGMVMIVWLLFAFWLVFGALA